MQLRSGISAGEFHDAFGANGRVHVPEVLQNADAKTLLNALRSDHSWNMVFFANGRHFDLDAEGWRNLKIAKRKQTIDIVNAEAQNSFSYMYDNIPLYDRYHGGADLPATLRSLFEFLNANPFLDFVRRLTGFDDIAFADAQVTRYGPGHFLTIHNDDVAGKCRRAAYVLNLTDNWREDWGGYLQFFDDDGHINGAYKPTFNALNIFAVPARHSVGMVAPYAGAPRYAITGWLRSGSDPKAA